MQIGSLAHRLAELGAGRHDIHIDNVHFVLYYDEHRAIGDNGQPVAGDITAELELYRVTGPDPLINVRELARIHVAPHGASGYGNPHAHTSAFERAGAAIADELLRERARSTIAARHGAL